MPVRAHLTKIANSTSRGDFKFKSELLPLR